MLLFLGGEALVRAAAALARRAGLSSLVVGLTVVSAMTSAPELAVTLDALARSQLDLAVGNIVGSNIANVLLVVGLAAALTGLTVQRQLLRLDLPFLLALSLLLFLLASDGRLGRIDAAILLGCLLVHTVVTLRAGRGDAATGPQDGSGGQDPAAEPTAPVLSLPAAASLLLLGVGLLVAGSSALVTGAVGLATAFGVSGLVVGLTVVAVGTSTPELVATIVAVRRGEPDIALGNAVGSNIFNLGFILGVPALIAGEGIPVPAAALALDIPLMVAAAVAIAPAAFTGMRLARWEGVMFVTLYAAYLGYVALDAQEHDALEGYSAVMAGFVLPLAGVAVLTSVWYEVRRLRARPHSAPATGPHR